MHGYGNRIFWDISGISLGLTNADGQSLRVCQLSIIRTP